MLPRRGRASALAGSLYWLLGARAYPVTVIEGASGTAGATLDRLAPAAASC